MSTILQKGVISARLVADLQPSPSNGKSALKISKEVSRGVGGATAFSFYVHLGAGATATIPVDTMINTGSAGTRQTTTITLPGGYSPNAAGVLQVTVTSARLFTPRVVSVPLSTSAPASNHAKKIREALAADEELAKWFFVTNGGTSLGVRLNMLHPSNNDSTFNMAFSAVANQAAIPLSTAGSSGTTGAIIEQSAEPGQDPLGTPMASILAGQAKALLATILNTKGVAATITTVNSTEKMVLGTQGVILIGNPLGLFGGSDSIVVNALSETTVEMHLIF